MERGCNLGTDRRLRLPSPSKTVGSSTDVSQSSPNSVCTHLEATVDNPARKKGVSFFGAKNTTTIPSWHVSRRVIPYLELTPCPGVWKREFGRTTTSDPRRPILIRRECYWMKEMDFFFIFLNAERLANLYSVWIRTKKSGIVSFNAFWNIQTSKVSHLT